MGLLSFVGDAFNDIFGGNSSRKDAQKYNLQNMEIQQQYAERNMALQNQYNIDAFNRENEYNSPVAQKLRNYQAGINPNWQDGSGVVAQQDSGVSASSPSGGLPTGSSVGGIGDILNLVKLGKDMKKIDSDIDLQDSQTGLNKAEAHLKQTEADNMESKLPYELPNIEANTGYQNAAAIKTEKESEQVFTYARRYSDLVQSQVEFNDKQIKVIEETLPKILKQYDANIKKAYAEAGLASYMPTYYQGSLQVGHEANVVKAAEVEVQKFNAQVNAERTYYQNQLDSALAGQASQLASHDKTLQALDDIKLDAEEYAQKKDWTRRERRVKHQELMRLDERARAEIDEINSRRDLNFMDKVKKRHDIIQGYLNSVSNLMQSGAKVMNAANPLKPFAQ